MKALRSVVIGCMLGAVSIITPDCPAGVSVGYHQTDGVNIPRGETVTLTDEVFTGDGGAFGKTGEGKLIVPMTKVDRQVSGWNVRNHSGEMRVEAGVDTTASVAPAVIASKAALWLRADSAVVTNSSDGTTQYVKKWVDVRDKGNPDSPKYAYATPAWGSLAPATSLGCPPELVEKDGTAALYFGGNTSGKYMKLSANIKEIRQNFVVHGMYECWGAVLGYSNGSSGGMIPGTSNGSVSTNKLTTHFSLRTELMTAYSAGRYHLDGEVLDPFTTPPTHGFQLLECEFPVRGDNNNRIFRCGYETVASDDTDKKVQGGDYVSEIILFTNVVTEAERVDIERYLMRKWSLPREDKFVFAYLPRPGAIVSVSNAVTELYAGEGESLPLADLRGGGTFRKTGMGTLEIGPSEETSFTGTFLWEGGTLFSRGGRPPAIRAESGDRFNGAIFTPYDYSLNRTPRIDIEGGAKLTRTTDAGEGNVVKTGNDWVRVNEVADSVDRIEVKEGVFALESKTHGADGYATDLPFSVAVTNSDFELPYVITSSPGLGGLGNAANAQNGWTGNCAYVAYTNAGSAWFGGYSVPPSSGAQVLRFGGNQNATTTVDLPVAGWYEISLRAKNRYGTGNGTANSAMYMHLCEVMFGETTETLERVGYLWASGIGFSRYTYRLPYASAGSHIIQIKTTTKAADGAMLIDDVEIRALGKVPETTATFKVPNGDFEQLDGNPWSSDAKTGAYSSIYSLANVPSGWTFDVSGSNFPLAEYNGAIGVVSPSITTRNSSMMLCGLWNQIQGHNRLFFYGQGAKASVTFTLPAGRYKFRADAARASLGMTPENYSAKDYEAPPQFTASVMVNGETTELGAVTRNTFLEGQVVWPVELMLNEDREVTLTLSQTVTDGVGWVDNLEFVPVTIYAERNNLLLKADAESELTPEWKITKDKSFFANSNVNRRNYDSKGTTKNFGYSAFEGRQYFNIQSAGTMSQVVSIPEAGLYRFKCHVRTRADSPSYCGNNLRIWYKADGSAATNYVDTLLMHYTGNYLERAWLIRFDASGNYELGITGLGVRSAGANADRESHLDGLSLRKLTETVDDVPQMPEDIKITVAEGARFVLDFPGRKTVRGLKLGDVSVPAGIVRANDYPDYLGGIGELEVKPFGLMLIVR